MEFLKRLITQKGMYVKIIILARNLEPVDVLGPSCLGRVPAVVLVIFGYRGECLH